MICHKCGEKISKELKKCPFCGADVKTIDGIELPELKSDSEIVHLDDTDVNLTDNYFEVELKDKEEDENSDKYDVAEMPSVDNKENTKEFDLSLEETRSISPLKDTIELKNVSLIDDINKQIEEVNEEAKQNDKNNVPLTVSEPEGDLSSVNSLKKRKKVLMFTGIGSLILAIGVIIYIIFFGANKDVIKGDYLIVLENSLNEYYETSQYEEIIKVLNTVKKDDEKIANVQKKTKEYVDKWFDEYVAMDIKTLGDFEDISSKYKNLISELHIRALITYDNRIIKALNDDDYAEIENKMSIIFNDSSLYFVAMDYYNQNDYNRAYTTLTKIDSSNSYYEKANDYKSNIINNIFKLIEKDITSIEEGIDLLDDYEKLNRYMQIEQVLIDYIKVYSSVELKNESRYQMLYQEYNDKVSYYTELISEKNENNTLIDESSENNSSTEIDSNQDINNEVITEE